VATIRVQFPRVRSYRKKGRTYFDVNCRRKGWTGPARLSFKTKAEALKKAKEIGELFERDGIDGLNQVSLSVTNRELERLEKQLAGHGKTLVDAVAHYLEFLQRTPPLTASVGRLTERWAAYVSTDTKKNNRSRTIQEIGTYAERFGRDFLDVPITEVDRPLVDRVVMNLKTREGGPVSPQTRRNYLTKFKQFLNWCVDQQLIATNPAATLSVSVQAKVPEVYTLDECRRILEVVEQPAHRPLIAFVALGLFAGLRPTEAERLDWTNIHRENHTISIEPSQTKVKRARNAEINPTLAAWLDRTKRSHRLIPANFLRRLRAFRKQLNQRWIPDGLRHTYATHWLGIHNDRARLAELLGNSVEVIGRHYVKPVTASDAEAFWRLGPQ
jgi:integrase